jgi:hypothetical protein
VSRRKNGKENVKVCYGHPVFQQPKEEKTHKTRSSSIRSFRKLNEVITRLKSNIHHNTITTTRLYHPCLSYSVSKAKETEQKVDLD